MKKWLLPTVLGVLVLFCVGIGIFLGLKGKDPTRIEHKLESRVKTLKEHQEKDSNVLSWIQVEGTNIDYPVLYSPSVDKSEIDYDYAWSNYKEDPISYRTVLYGHNILNVSSKPLVGSPFHRRFEQLLGFVYLDVAEKNQFIEYTVGDKDYVFQIFSVAFVEDDKLDRSNLSTEAKREEYIKTSLEDSFFLYDVDVSKEDYILSLITCTRFFGADKDIAFKIDAKLIREDSSQEYVSLKTKEKYAVLVEQGRFEEI